MSLPVRYGRTLTAFLLMVFLFVQIEGRCQYFSTGQDPASLKWKQIKTKEFRIIYPDFYEIRAQYLANIMEKVARIEPITLQAKNPRIPLIIHTESATANGVTVWAPRRIELYPAPDPDAYPEEWLEQLAIHEYRHALQINKMNRGFTKGLYYLLGEQATGGILGALVPTWFLEGDATVTETALSRSGRGRTGWFESIMRAQLLEKGIYNYNKATLGSYKTFIPDSYELGYYLVGMGRKNFGPELWNYTLDHVAKYPFMIVPFADGIKRKTGMSKTGFYRNSLSELAGIWKLQDSLITRTPSRMISRRDPRNFTVYTHPMNLNDSIIISEMESNEDVYRMASLDMNGRVKPLFRLGAYMDGSNSMGSGRIAWCEYEPDIRWSNRSFASVWTYDLTTGKKKRITKRQKYYASCISDDGTQIVAVRISPEGSSFLEVLDAVTGKVLHSFKANGAETYQSPGFSEDGRILIYIVSNHKGKSIATRDLGNGREKYWLPFSYVGVDGPSQLKGHYIMFSWDYTGIENLYAIDTLDGRIYQATSVPFGAYDPDYVPEKDKLIYSEYTADGLMIAETHTDISKWKPLDQVQDHYFRLGDILSSQEKGNIQDSCLADSLFRMMQLPPGQWNAAGIKSKQYPSKKYSKAGHLFNIHSWAPVSVNASNLTAHPGVMALSQNVMSSMFASAGYDWDYNDQVGKAYLNLSYQGFFPVFDLSTSWGKQAGYYTTTTSAEKRRFTWNEVNLGFMVSVPLNLTLGIWYRGITPAVGVSAIYVYHDNTTPAAFTAGWIPTMNYSLFAYQYLRSNYQDMFPKWGQNLRLTVENSPFGLNDLGSLWAAETNLYFPGILRHHGIWLYGGYQQRNENLVYGYSYGNEVNYPRGYVSGYNNHLFSFSGNYKFPMFCPDWSVGGLFYFKRFKLNLFWDQAMGDNSSAIDWNLPELYQTLGSELTAELHILRFVYPFELGVRPMYFPLSNSWGCQFLYSVNF
jgi:hypothetical protein